MRDPIRDPRRLAEIEHAEAQPSHEVGCSWGVGQRCTCKAIRAERGVQPWSEDMLNAAQIAGAWAQATTGNPEADAAFSRIVTLINDASRKLDARLASVERGIEEVQRLNRSALAQLEGSPLRAPQEDPR